MKTRNLLLSLFALLLLSSGKSSKDVIKSKWRADAPNPTQLDTLDYRIYNKASGVLYTISNNDEYIFVNFRTDNEPTKAKIFGAGLTLWIDTLKIKNKVNGINYPLKPLNGQQPSTSEFQYHLKNNIQEIELTGFGLPEVYHTYTKNELGINVSMMIDKNETLYYSAQIPIKTLYRAKGSFTTDSTKFFYLGLTAGNQSDKNSNITDHGTRTNRSGSGNMNPGSGGVGGGLTGNMGGNPMGGNKMDQIQTEIGASQPNNNFKLWVKFSLAQKK